MRRDGRRTDLRVNISQRRNGQAEAQLIHETSSRLFCLLLEFKREQSAIQARSEQTTGQGMLRMSLQAWIMNALNRGVLTQEAGDLEGIGAMSLHAQGQRFQTTHREIRLKRAEHSTEQIRVHPQLLEQALLAGDRHAGGTVAMATDILGRAMYHNIEAMSQ